MTEQMREELGLGEQSPKKRFNFKLPKISRPNFSKAKMPKIQIRKDIVFGVLCYLPILVLVPYFFGRKDYFVEYHSRQGMALLGVWAIAAFSFFFPVVPYVFVLFLLIGIILGEKNIFTRKEKPIFLIGRWAENLEI